MDFMKPEPEPDGESYLAFSSSENHWVNVKGNEDPLLMKFPVTYSENEVSHLYVCTHHDSKVQSLILTNS
jgi:hypothetical protein